MLRSLALLALTAVTAIPPIDQIGAGRPGATIPVLPGAVDPPAAESGTGAISGVVVDAVTGAPLADVLVNLSRPGRSLIRPQTRQITDQKGRFVFVDLPPGDSYALAAARPGYLEGGYSRENAAGGST